MTSFGIFNDNYLNIYIFFKYVPSAVVYNYVYVYIMLLIVFIYKKLYGEKCVILKYVQYLFGNKIYGFSYFSFMKNEIKKEQTRLLGIPFQELSKGF